MGFSKSSLKAKIAFFGSIVGLLLVIIGLSTPAWTVTSTLGYSNSGGLFQYCSSTPIVDLCASYDILTDWMQGTQAMAVIGFLLGLADLVVLGIYVFLKNEMKVLQIAGLGLAFATAFCCLVAVVIWAAKAHVTTFGYSFAIEIIGSLIYIAVGVVIVLDVMIPVNTGSV